MIIVINRHHPRVWVLWNWVFFRGFYKAVYRCLYPFLNGMIFHRTPDVGFHGKVEIVGVGCTVQRWISRIWPGLHHVSAGGKDGHFFVFVHRRKNGGNTEKVREKRGIPFIDDCPIKTSIYHGFSMATWNNQRVIWPETHRAKIWFDQNIIGSGWPIQLAIHHSAPSLNLLFRWGGSNLSGSSLMFLTNHQRFWWPHLVPGSQLQSCPLKDHFQWLIKDRG